MVRWHYWLLHIGTNGDSGLEAHEIAASSGMMVTGRRLSGSRLYCQNQLQEELPSQSSSVRGTERYRDAAALRLIEPVTSVALAHGEFNFSVNDRLLGAIA